MDLPAVTKHPVWVPPGVLRSGLLNLSRHVLQRADNLSSARSPLARLAPRMLQ
jgi:hypothetical protein